MPRNETGTVACNVECANAWEDRSNSQVLECRSLQQQTVGALLDEQPGGFVDRSGNVVPAAKLPLFLTRGITQTAADYKLRRMPLAMHISALAGCSTARAHDRRRLFDRDTRLPVYIVDQGDAHWSREASGNIWPDELSRIRHAIGGDIGAACVMMLVEMARALSKPQMFVVVEQNGPVVQTAKPRKVGKRLQMLVQRPPGLTKWLNGEQLNAMAGTKRNQTRSQRVTLLHQANAILAEEHRALEGGHGHDQRFLLNPLLFKGNSAVIEAVSDEARERWCNSVNFATDPLQIGVSFDLDGDAHERQSAETRSRATR